tara:strand:+ start:467 stop:691 length:225 start_codon:yes stop_codon:yes gene_type:complete
MDNKDGKSLPVWNLTSSISSDSFLTYSHISSLFLNSILGFLSLSDDIIFSATYGNLQNLHPVHTSSIKTFKPSL